MNRILLLFFLFIFTLTLQAQKDTAVIKGLAHRNDVMNNMPPVIAIYPVPVRNNSMTIRTDREISSVKITNIIGQDIFRNQYNNPEATVTITLDSPKRGMYLVTIFFSDGTRVVKKIMIEESE
ncbi:MAG TPA: T9SS type A sorting domain-containing protein [Bacteroidales bacterium]|nr:T9SS type A sorting domain-containing protein [Bacteroidales bacterium]HPT21691.1 T9SS type A sorting domain-containing protein [Bacteroidales bacterium]